MSTPNESPSAPNPVPASHVKDDAHLVRGEGIEVVAPGVWILQGQGNSLVVELDAGLVIVDSGPGGRVTAGMIRALREVSNAPVHAICFSHGHLGYNSGLPHWLEHARVRGEPAPRTIAHGNLPRRVERYQQTMALQEQMAEIQFRRSTGAYRGKFPAHLPGETFAKNLLLGTQPGRCAELLWAPSETDDSLAMWLPEQRILYAGPAVIDSIPNLGTPFRTQRDTLRWADTLDRLAELRPALLIRQLGPPVVGEAELQHMLGQTAKALRWVHAEVVRLMNDGLSERQMLATIQFPPDLFEAPWMQPTYGDPAWIARDVFRSENGWWDRNPTTLHPSPPEEASAVIAQAITDKRAILDHASALAAQGKTQLALHVVDLLATLACTGPEIDEARRLKAGWMRSRANELKSYVSKSIYHAAAQMVEDGQPASFGIT